jgi:hypothetical protein
MKNEKRKLCPTDGCLTASGGDFGLPPQAFPYQLIEIFFSRG